MIGHPFGIIHHLVSRVVMSRTSRTLLSPYIESKASRTALPYLRLRWFRYAEQVSQDAVGVST